MTIKLRAPSGTALLLLALTLVAALLLVWSYSKLEWEEEDFDIGFGDEAKRNEFYAAQLFLKRFNIDSDWTINRKLIADLPREGDAEKTGIDLKKSDTLIMLNSRGTLTKDKAERLWHWLENGGTLLYSVENHFLGDKGFSDNFLDLLGLSVDVSYGEDDFASEGEVGEEDGDADSIEDEDAENSGIEKTLDDILGGESENTAKPDSAEETADDEGQSLLDERCEVDDTFEYMSSRYARPLKIRLRDDLYIYNDRDDYPSHAVFSNEQLLFGAFQVGSGRVFISTNNGIWSNTEIQCADHALLLTELINPNGKVWFLLNTDAPALSVMFWNEAPWLLVLFAAALLLWLWMQATRFGPILSREILDRRSFAEHLRASARMLWRYRHQDVLLERLRSDVVHRLRILNLRYENMEESEKIDFILGLCNLQRVEIYQALFKPLPSQDQDFVMTVQYLKKIKEST